MKAKSVEVNVRGFDNGHPPIIVDHRFCCSPRGELEHYTNGTLRAQVPPEGFELYLDQYPVAAPVIAALRGEPAKSVNTAAASRARQKKRARTR